MTDQTSSEFTIAPSVIETRSMQINWTWLFWSLLSLHCLAWFIGPLLTMPTAPLDCIEKIALGLQWQWGYSKHPPLTHWLSTLAFLVTGSPKWPVLLMAQISVAACFIAVWQFSRRFMQPWAAFAAVFCLEGMYYFTFATPQFNENIILLPLWSWCAIFFFDGMEKQSLKAWIFAGLLAGLACIAKYETVVFLLTLFLFLCINKTARQSWRHKGVYLALTLCVAITLPNIFWLIHHNFAPIQYVLNKSAKTTLSTAATWPLHGLIQPLLDLLTQVATVIPALFLLLPFYFLRSQPKESFHQAYLKAIAIGPAAITFTLALLTGAHIYALWGIPFFIWLGAWLMAAWSPVYKEKATHIFLISIILMASVMIVGRTVQLVYGPNINGRITYQHYPAKQLATLATQMWHEHQSGPLPVIAGTSREVQSVVAYSNAPYPTPYIDWNDPTNAWTSSEDVTKRGAVFIYQIKEANVTDFPSEIRVRFPNLGTAEHVYIPYQTSAKVPPLSLLMAVLPKRS